MLLIIIIKPGRENCNINTLLKRQKHGIKDINIEKQTTSIENVEKNMKILYPENRWILDKGGKNGDSGGVYFRLLQDL